MCIFFTANNFVNSVLANVIIKIKENYINAYVEIRARYELHFMNVYLRKIACRHVSVVKSF
jgi:hypothetical protein